MALRRARQPLIAVALVALTGTVALEVLWLALDAQVADGPATAPPSASPPTALPTPLLSLRRAPATLSRSANAERLRVSLAPLVASVGDRSCVEVAVDGRAVVAEHETIGVIPGSNEKLPIAASALDVLGADHVFTTTVKGTLGADGTVTGDLALVGGGDPLLATAWYPDSAKYQQRPATSLEALADTVVAAGVRSVSGSVVGDEHRYDSERYAPFWDPSLHSEVGPLSALIANDAIVTPGGGKVDDPALGAAQLFARLLRDRGITIAGEPGTAAAPAGAATIATIDSAPLRDVVGEMLTNSDNNTAELLVKELGVARGGAGTRAAGLAVARDALAAMGLPLQGLTLEDGSGLSRGNRLTCSFVVALLGRYGLDDPLRTGLAVAATTGTLGPELTGSPVAGVLRAKTGSLTGVKALSGFLPVGGGSVVDFSLLLNGPGADSASYYQPIWRTKLAAVLATYPAGPTADELAPRPLGGS